jgi:hypothetical protein
MPVEGIGGNGALSENRRRGEVVGQQRRAGQQVLRPGGEVGVLSGGISKQKWQTTKQKADAHGNLLE